MKNQLVFRHSDEDSRHVVHVSGEIDLETANALVDEVARLGSTEPVYLDLADVSFMDSTGIRALLRINTATTEAVGQPLTLVGAGESTRKLVTLTGIDQVLRVEY